MEHDIKERCVILGQYIAETGQTVRTCASKFGVSKSTVHKDVTERLNRHGYDDILTFELNKTCSTNRHDKDSYRHMDAVEYIAQAYVRACRVAALKSRGKSGK